MRPREHYVQQLEGLHTELRALGQMVIVSITKAIAALRQQHLVTAKEVVGEHERIGDYAKGIAKITVRHADQPLVNPLLEIPQMAEQAINMLGNALDAYVNVDAEAARRLSNADDTVDELVTRMRAELIELIQSDPSTTARAVDLLFVTHNLERIADRTTNIAERVIFIASGDIVDLNP